MVRSLLYLMAMRPDIKFSVCLCARFQASPRTSHWQAIKRIFKYLRHTPDFGLWYSASSSLALHGFSDADFAGCRLDRKSTARTCKLLGSSTSTVLNINDQTVWSWCMQIWSRNIFYDQLMTKLNWSQKLRHIWSTMTNRSFWS
jgi:hypothetical protein